MESKFEKLNGMLNGYPEKKVKKERKERGLYERTDVQLITEDNKMVLND